MAGLQGLEENLSGEGLHVLGFYSNDFGNQGGDPDDIAGCTEDHGITFEQFQIAPVKSPDAQPVFAWLYTQPSPGPSASVEPTWNFHKYLISRDGQLVAHWDSAVYPGDDPENANDDFDTNPIVVAIRAELEK
jgi:glutathione peroxidase